MTYRAGGAGEIWDQPYRVHGADRRWLILSSLSSMTGSWVSLQTSFRHYLLNC